MTRLSHTASFRFRVAAAVVTSLLVAACASATPEAETPGSSAPDSAELLAMGKQYAAGGDLLRAEQYYAVAMERGHDEAEVLPLLVDVCVRSDRFNTALHYAQPRLEQNPSDWRLRTVVASLHLAVGNTGAARQELERVISDQPDEALPHYLLGVLLHESGDDKARDHFARYLALEPNGPHAEEARTLVEGAPLPVRIDQPSGPL